MLTRMIAHAARAIRKPWWSLAFATMLVVDACSLPQTTTIGSISLLVSCRCVWRPRAHVVQTDRGLSLFSDDELETVSVLPLIATISCDARHRENGFWSVTRRWWDPTLLVAANLRNLTPTELAALRPQSVDYLVRDYGVEPAYAELVRVGAGPTRDIAWTGYVHNLASLALGTLTMLSFGWIRDRAHARQQKRAAGLGLCPVCRYDLRGDLSHGCPECGWYRV